MHYSKLIDTCIYVILDTVQGYQAPDTGQNVTKEHGWPTSPQTREAEQSMLTHNGKEIVIEFTKLPETVNGITGDIEDSGYYLVLINSAKTPQRQRRAIGHELAHIFLDHFNQSERPLQEIEHEANINAWEYYRLYKNGTLEITSR